MIGNFVQETANAPGSAATVTLAGPAAGRRGIIAAFGAGATVYLGMDDGTQWQLVEALTVAGPPQQITITTVINNSAGTTNRLNFTGSVRIYSAIPAERNVYERPDGTIQGATATGDAVFRAADAAAARTAIGATATGSAVLTAADAAAARGALGATHSAELVGAVAYFPATAAPAGWLKANGALISRTTYADLWAFAQASGNIVSDATWTGGSDRGAFSQGDGSTTFRVPDLRGEFLRGWDDGRGVDSGRAVGTFQGQDIQSHAHTQRGVNQVSTAGGDITSGTNTGTPANHSVSTASTGGAETRPRNVALLACIRF
jgi:microcystin-dependent protein